ncbi:very short patch repair endonuclease [Prescottella subtropica]|uniref:very short patch repair endonuclease n=1 Tax=Prescottella subtropica TaxID=2545757 RepID=UPI0010F91560|nr:very short patch repair endonuclease [Prescottella subtropica]
MALSRDGRPKTAVRRPRPTETTSWASTPSVRSRMQRQQSRDTKPELAVRRLLHRDGLRYRVDTAPLENLRRRADVVFRSARVALFIDGCYWHGCPTHGQRTTTVNGTYWREKIERNRARDRDTDRQLRAAGWLSLRAWEHDDPREVAEMVITEVRSRTRVRQSESMHGPGSPSREMASGEARS